MMITLENKITWKCAWAIRRLHSQAQCTLVCPPTGPAVNRACKPGREAKTKTGRLWTSKKKSTNTFVTSKFPLSLCHTHIHTVSLSLSHTHTHTHYLFLFLTLTHKIHTHTHLLQLFCSDICTVVFFLQKLQWSKEVYDMRCVWKLFWYFLTEGFPKSRAPETNQVERKMHLFLLGLPWTQNCKIFKTQKVSILSFIICSICIFSRI